MPGARRPALSPRDEGLIACGGGLYALPILHEGFESADLVRGAVARLEPDAVAIEFPASLQDPLTRALERLPAISVLLYENARGETLYFPIQPADALVEAARAARERGIPFVCADLDLDGYADYRDPAPDPYALARLGGRRVYEAFRRHPRAPDPADPQREAAMAYHVLRLLGQGARRVLLVCGMHHVERVRGQLARAQTTPLVRPRRREVRLVHPHPDCLAEVLSEPPFYVAVYEARRRRLPEAPPASLPREPGRRYGPFRVLSGGAGDDPQRVPRAVARCARRAGWACWSAWRRGAPSGTRRGAPAAIPGPLDRLRLQWALLDEAAQTLRALAPEEAVQPWQRRHLARYLRNLAWVEGRLLVDLYDLLVAARGCVSENFAFELYELARAYPHQAARATDLPTVRISAEELYDGVRRLKLVRRQRRPKRRLPLSLAGRSRRAERVPGEWLAGFDAEALCSYPPEDVAIESFGRYLKERARTWLREERSRSAPFTCSMLDGVDVRETIRHWVEGRGIYVRELARGPAEVGSVVVIFDEDDDPREERYPFRMTWLGEHEQESDMAFYATDPRQSIVGPGIARVTYGGFLLSYPPGRMLDVWADRDYRMAETKAEVLLLAALDYTQQRIVVHVASRPPRPLLHQLAARFGLRIVHIPLGTLSPPTLQRLRVMHILSGHDKRALAPEYVGRPGR